MGSNTKQENVAPRKSTRRENIYERLKSQVASFRAQPGQHLSITNLAATFHSSNTPVREALVQLAAERLVDAGPTGGFHVRNFRLAEMQELLHLSRLLLSSCIRDAVHDFEFGGLPRPTALDLQSRYRATRVLRSNPEETAAFVAGVFRGVARMSGNNEIVDIVSNICDRTHHIRAWHVQEIPSGRRFSDQLAVLLESLQRDDRITSALWLDRLLEHQVDRLPHVASKALAEMLLATGI
ncbi:GntR family transcriptional regulator [Shinella sumterensis]|uniref:DNA-binding GntR family transcriptional regulator n=1 Tax=Rhizobium subbaraonis TaxID=908946 RepID=A0A285UWI1_9HYPH|nr:MULTISPECIES: GntR family transcriptional regulator [Rhizobiaceae]MCW5712271.1 GntR family transcriptional regulator [Shinella sp.]WLS08683.1 GntR family transcriptional regulator [Shinella sumterensis]SOC44591.1 DNA-binding GntR family transcriptional regulator [Rhizobium subbaraonis]